MDIAPAALRQAMRAGPGYCCLKRPAAPSRRHRWRLSPSRRPPPVTKDLVLPQRRALRSPAATVYTDERTDRRHLVAARGLYRDVAPRHYDVSVDSFGSDFNQTRDVDLTPGQHAYFKVVSLKGWVGRGGGDGPGYARPTFYVWQIPAQVAQDDVKRSPFYGGG